MNDAVGRILSAAPPALAPHLGRWLQRAGEFTAAALRAHPPKVWEAEALRWLLRSLRSVIPADELAEFRVALRVRKPPRPPRVPVEIAALATRLGVELPPARRPLRSRTKRPGFHEHKARAGDPSPTCACGAAGQRMPGGRVRWSIHEKGQP